MKHKTEFENMNATQRSLHNLICILDDPCELTYEQSISNAIDEITELKQQRDELLAWKDKALEVYPNTDRLIALHVRAIAIQAKAIAVAKGDKT